MGNRVEGASESRVLPGRPRVTLENLARQGRKFDSVFLPESLLQDMPEGLVAPGGRTVSLESLPLAPQQAKGGSSSSGTSSSTVSLESLPLAPQQAKGGS